MKTAFKFLDPTKEPNYHWCYWDKVQSIFWRARKLVRGRSKEEISTILHDAEALLETYFDQERYETIRLIRADGRDGLIERDEDGHFERFRTEAFDYYDIRNEENTSELDALEEALDKHFDPTSVEVENVQPSEYFGCLALSRLDDFVERRDFKFNWDTFEHEKNPFGGFAAKEHVQLAEILLDALDCVSRGEAEKIRSDIKKMIDKSYIEKIQIVKIREGIIQAFEADEAERRKQRSKELIARRHQKNWEIKDKAVAWFVNERKRFPSAAQAAKAYCEELSKQGIKREPSVVVVWFREHAKQKKIRLRP